MTDISRLSRQELIARRRALGARGDQLLRDNLDLAHRPDGDTDPRRREIAEEITSIQEELHEVDRRLDTE
jgi:hypothetical protein